MSNKKKAETLPLVKNNLLNNDDHIDWSDQELDELVGDPLEHVLEQMRRRPQNVSRLQYYRSMLFFSVLCFILGAVVSCLVMIFIWNPTLRTFPNALKDTVITQKIVHYTDVNSIKTFYRFLTNQIHVAGSHADKETADYIYSTWKKQGLDAHLVPYSVFLSYPNKEKFNRVSVVLNNRTEMFHSTSWEKILHSLGKNNSEIYPPFAAYSPSTVEPLFGDPVYANYGEFEDFLLLRKKAIPLERCIAIIRYGKISPAQKVNFAEQFGIKGVILYPDPADYAMHGLKDVYPSSIHLPSLGVPYSSLNLLKGDPLTPLYPSIENAYRIQEEKAKLPKIPVFPINYEDASYILRNITGSKSPETWKGALPNVEYLIGSGYKNNAKIKMEVNNNNTQVMIYNVIGIIPGSDEPDRFVLLGNHRDSWTYGSLDPSSGTSAMLEISHIFGKLLKEGWKPRRSILFCSWSASLYGLIGSREWIEENQKNLIEKIVAYIDVSMAVEGNTTLAIQSTPLMYRVFSEAAKKIPNPNALEVSNGLLSVFNSWLNHSSQNLINPSLPEFRNLDDSSDHATFLFGFGIPSANLKYSCYKTVTVCSPLIHTLYETSAVQSKLIDSEFQAVGLGNDFNILEYADPELDKGLVGEGEKSNILDEHLDLDDKDDELDEEVEEMKARSGEGKKVNVEIKQEINAEEEKKKQSENEEGKLGLQNELNNADFQTKFLEFSQQRELEKNEETFEEESIDSNISSKIEEGENKNVCKLISTSSSSSSVIASDDLTTCQSVVSFTNVTTTVASNVLTFSSSDQLQISQHGNGNIKSTIIAPSPPGTFGQPQVSLHREQENNSPNQTHFVDHLRISQPPPYPANVPPPPPYQAHNLRPQSMSVQQQVITSPRGIFPNQSLTRANLSSSQVLSSNGQEKSLLQEQPLLLEDLVEQEKREQRRQNQEGIISPHADALLSDIDFERLKADVLSGPPDDSLGGPGSLISSQGSQTVTTNQISSTPQCFPRPHLTLTSNQQHSPSAWQTQDQTLINPCSPRTPGSLHPSPIRPSIMSPSIGTIGIHPASMLHGEPPVRANLSRSNTSPGKINIKFFII
ncbi:N-acetylated-alpha-linked acidic dipeptidase 2-like [Centruroides sculpturatus]|uniref:N-acetylated-alpha-linked acidic dipeptidase 2-like n=1 Tax=Centruroides sculpturatus TaxID=218467 RepID=UPI000C6E52E8|nr:N-acetylated-alpha-linked acidic dipeptidase 2-like [Centruroides sculpturatus]